MCAHSSPNYVLPTHNVCSQQFKLCFAHTQCVLTAVLIIFCSHTTCAHSSPNYVLCTHNVCLQQSKLCFAHTQCVLTAFQIIFCPHTQYVLTAVLTVFYVIKPSTLKLCKFRRFQSSEVKVLLFWVVTRTSAVSIP